MCISNESRDDINRGHKPLYYFDQSAYCKHHLVRTLKSLNMSQHINVLTRPKSKTCLDHVHSTHEHFITDIVVPNIGLSDHLPVFIWRKYFNQNRFSTHKTINYSDFKRLDDEALLNDLYNSSWYSAFVFDDLNDVHVLDTLELLLNESIKRRIPQKTKAC